MELIRGGTWQMLLQFFMLESMRTLPFNAGSEAWIKGPLSLSLSHSRTLQLLPIKVVLVPSYYDRISMQTLCAVGNEEKVIQRNLVT